MANCLDVKLAGKMTGLIEYARNPESIPLKQRPPAGWTHTTCSSILLLDCFFSFFIFNLSHLIAGCDRTMTLRQESAQYSSTFESIQTECGRCSCIILYTSEKCVLCDAALEIMQSVIADFGLPQTTIRIVDVESDADDGCGLPAPLGLPAMRVCEEYIGGLPDIDVARGAVMNAVLKRCFSDGCS